MAKDSPSPRNLTDSLAYVIKSGEERRPVPTGPQQRRLAPDVLALAMWSCAGALFFLQCFLMVWFDWMAP